MQVQTPNWFIASLILQTAIKLKHTMAFRAHRHSQQHLSSLRFLYSCIQTSFTYSCVIFESLHTLHRAINLLFKRLGQSSRCFASWWMKARSSSHILVNSAARTLYRCRKNITTTEPSRAILCQRGGQGL